MTGDEFDVLLRRLAREYNAPPDTPREEMWAGITAARRTLRELPQPRRRPWLRGLGGLAAMLALGFALGRLATRDGVAPDAATQRGPVLEQAAATDRVEPPELVAATGDPDAGPDVEAPAAAGQGGGTAPARSAGATELRDGPRVVTARTPAASGGPREAAPVRTVARAGGAGGGGEPRLPAEDAPTGGVYALVATQTLTQGEALLTTFRAARDPDELDPQIAAWARDVLFATRLLLDTQAGEESALRGLLEDLELVLLQIAHLSGSPADSVERAWIHETLRQRDMLPRLRTAVPAGPVAGI